MRKISMILLMVLVAININAQDLPLAGKIIGIDPGHADVVTNTTACTNSNKKFIDVGVAPTEYNSCEETEAFIVENTATELKALLIAAGAQVYFSNRYYTAIGYQTMRIKPIWEKKADLFISLHTDYAGFFDKNRTKVYYRSDNEEDKVFGQNLCNQLKDHFDNVSELEYNKETSTVEKKYYNVLKVTNTKLPKSPAVLIEILMLKGEKKETGAKYLKNYNNHGLIAQQLYEGILDYYHIENNYAIAPSIATTEQSSTISENGGLVDITCWVCNLDVTKTYNMKFSINGKEAEYTDWNFDKINGKAQIIGLKIPENIKFGKQAVNFKLWESKTTIVNRDIYIDILDVFPDIPTSHWSYIFSNRLKTDKIIHGVENGEFKGENDTKVGEFIKFAVNSSFDNENDRLYEIADCYNYFVNTMKFNYVAESSLKTAIKRDLAIKIAMDIFYKYKKGITQIPSITNNPFCDIESNPYKDYILWGAKEDIIKGNVKEVCGDKVKYQPTKILSRYATSVVIDKIRNIVNKSFANIGELAINSEDVAAPPSFGIKKSTELCEKIVDKAFFTINLHQKKQEIGDEYSYYWEATGGNFEQSGENLSTVVWYAPTVREETRNYYITAYITNGSDIVSRKTISVEVESNQYKEENNEDNYLIEYLVPSEFGTIQEAINFAFDNSGGIVKVAQGEYFENITIYNDVYVVSVGQDPTNTIINGNGQQNTVVFNNCLNGGLIGFTIQNSGKNGNFAGIKISGGEQAPIIANCIITDNGHGLFIQGNAQPFVINNTIAYNSRKGLRTGGNSPASIVNNIVAFNGEVEIERNGGHDFHMFSGNCVFDTDNNLYENIETGESDISQAPLFVFETDLHLQSGSPCVNACEDLNGEQTEIGAFGSLDFDWLGTYQTELIVSTDNINSKTTGVDIDLESRKKSGTEYTTMITKSGYVHNLTFTELNDTKMYIISSSIAENATMAFSEFETSAIIYKLNETSGVWEQKSQTNLITANDFSGVWAITGNMLLRIDENSIVENPFKLYPNPTDGNLTVEYLNVSNTTTINIYDLSGKLLINRKMNSQQMNIDLSNFGNQTLILQIIDKNKVVGSEKIIKR